MSNTTAAKFACECGNTYNCKSALLKHARAKNHMRGMSHSEGNMICPEVHCSKRYVSK